MTTAPAASAAPINPATHGTPIKGSESRWWVTQNGIRRLVVWNPTGIPHFTDRETALKLSGETGAGIWSENNYGNRGSAAVLELAALPVEPESHPPAAPTAEELARKVAPELFPDPPPAAAPAPPPPPLTITTQATPWFERPADHLMSLDRAIEFTKEMASASRSRDLELDDFELMFDNGKVRVIPRRSHLGPKFKWALNHWSFGQLCTLISAPAGFLRTIPGDLAVECLNVKLRQRNRAISVYRTTSKVNGTDADTIRALTSKRYKRYNDHRLLTWVKDHGFDVTSVFVSDRGVDASVRGQTARTPDHDSCDLVLLVGNSEVGAASISTTAALQRGSLWRIPITMAGARVRHTGDVDAKALDKLDAAKKAFEGADVKDLQETLESRGTPEVKSEGAWFAWLKSRGVGKHKAKKILPDPDSDGDITVSRWELAVKLARMASDIPYFDDKLREEMTAAKVLGI
jgi:hypothetical protein